VRGFYQGQVLLNQAFSDSKLKEEFADQQFSVVHIASHGQFDHDVNRTFILTYDAKLTLDDLETLIRPSEFRGKPVELLALSACQTAAGDDRAALGLAGVAVKAGARSALATLWFVNDQASTFLISEFYSQWSRQGSVSKAKALQLAQQKMLADRRYHHPCYWAPYVVIGNWL
jgi:CHAT domain-containing protein